MGNLTETIANSAKLKGVADTIKIAGLSEMLNTDGPYTVLCPHDEAFAQIPRSFFNSLLDNRDELLKLVKYHIIKGNLTSKDLNEKLKTENSFETVTLEGHSVVFRSSGLLRPHFMVNDATVVTSDLRADNGIVHIIDKVLFFNNKVE